MTMDVRNSSVSRRSFVKAAGVGAGVGLACATSSAVALAEGSSAEATGEGTPETVSAQGAGETLLPNPAGLEFAIRPVEGQVAFEADPVDASSIVETVEADVVVCGAGLAGLSAAVSASENGLKTVLLEKGAIFAARGTEVGAINDSVHNEAGVVHDAADFVNDGVSTAHFRCDRSVWKRYADRSGEALDWAMGLAGDACGKFYCIGGNTEFAGVTTWGTGVRMDNGFYSFVEMLEARAAEFGAEIRYETPAVQLVMEDGGVAGVVAKGEAGYIKVLASKGVVLATGGYENNWEMLTQRIRPRDLAVYGWLNPTTTNTGDGILMGLAAGALEDDWPHILMNDPWGVPTGGRATGIAPAFLRVNARGERFVNESLSFEYLSNAIMYQDGAHDFVIMSGDLMAAIDAMKGGAPWTTESMYESIQDLLVQADSIEELAEKCGIDPAGLAATVERYNELCALGEDVDFGKSPDCLVALDEGPFYAVAEGGTCLVTVNGLRTDADSRVLSTSGKPIPGLFALGNASGSMFFGTYPHHQSAVSHGRCLTFGYLVGRRLAGLE